MEQTNETHNNFTILPFGSDISLHREDIYQFAEKDSDPMGHEQLQMRQTPLMEAPIPY